MRQPPPALLFCLLLLAPQVHGQGTSAPDPWTRTDPPDDLTVVAGGAASPGLPTAAYLQFLDVTGLQIDDPDGDLIEFRLKTKAPIRTTPTAESAQVGTIFILFQLPGSSANGVVRVIVNGGQENGNPVGFANFGGACSVEEGNERYCYGTPLQAETRPDGWLSLGVAKTTFLVGDSGRYGVRDLPVRLEAGDLLAKVRVRTASVSDALTWPIPGAPTVEDRAGGDWAYPLRFSSSLPTLKLNTTAIGVIAGEENIVKVALKNLAERKRVVNLTAAVDRSEVPGWKVDVTPVVTIAGKNETTLLLRVTAPPLTAGSTRASVRIVGTVLSEGRDAASLRIEFTASRPMDRGSNRFFLHSNYYESALDVVSGPYREIEGTSGYASRDEQDPRYDDRYGIRMDSHGQGTSRWYSNLEPVPNPVRAGADPVMRAHLRIDSPHTLAGTLRIRISQGFNSDPVANLEKQVTLNAGRNEVDLEGAVARGALRLPAGTGLWLEVSFRSDSPLMPLIGFFGLPPLLVAPRTSWLEFPHERDRDLEIQVKGPRVVLAPTEDTFDFIYPGRNRIFEMDLRNEEPREHRVEVVYENVTEGWSVDVLPGSRFVLKANESAHIGIRVIAPAAAKEQAWLSPRILVRGIEDGAVYHSVKLNLTVTSGIEDLQNETFHYADEDAAKLEPLAKQGSPALGAAPLLLVAALIASGVRRFRARP